MKSPALFCLTLTLLCACVLSIPASATQPNIVFFLADDLGYGDLGSYGHPIIKTPNIDKLAEEGVRLTDCHSGGTVCSPSRSAFLTGRNPYRSGFFYIASGSTHLRTEEITVAEILRDQGYETGFWGKWHLSNLEKGEPNPGDQGFDYWLGTSLNPFEGPQNPKKFLLNGNPVGEVEGWYCDVIVDDASDWLKNKRDKEKPFFMFVSAHEPHTPIAPPAKYSALYDNAEVDALAKNIKYGDVTRPPKDLSDNKKHYYGTVTQLDDAFGRLMKSLDELGLRENTIVVFTSDNGPEAPVSLEESLGDWEDPIRDQCFGTPGDLRGMKRFPYEGGHRVPGIVRYPGIIPAGLESDILFNGSDFLPTFAKLAGATIPEDRAIDGDNAFNAFLDKKVKRDTSVVWYYPNHEDSFFRMPQMAMRKDQFTLIGHLPKKPESLSLRQWITDYNPQQFELYDIHQDPAQTNDLSKQHPEIIQSMKKEMTALWRSMTDEGLSAKVLLTPQANIVPANGVDSDLK